MAVKGRSRTKRGKKRILCKVIEYLCPRFYITQAIVHILYSHWFKLIDFFVEVEEENGIMSQSRRQFAYNCTEPSVAFPHGLGIRVVDMYIGQRLNVI